MNWFKKRKPVYAAERDDPTPAYTRMKITWPEGEAVFHLPCRYVDVLQVQSTGTMTVVLEALEPSSTFTSLDPAVGDRA